METTKNGDGTMTHVVKAGGYILKVITFFFQRISTVSLRSYLPYLDKTQATKDSLVSKNQIGKWVAWSSFLTLFSISAHLLLCNYWNRFEVILDAQNFSWQSTQKYRTERNSPNIHYNTSSIILLICFQSCVEKVSEWYQGLWPNQGIEQSKVHTFSYEYDSAANILFFQNSKEKILLHLHHQLTALGRPHNQKLPSQELKEEMALAVGI